MNQFIKSIQKNPKRLFLIDGIGAMVSAILLGLVLVRLEHVFGIPQSTLYFLAIWPLWFALYDLYSYRQDNERLSKLLKIIAILNLMYCLLSITCGLYHYDSITHWGRLYIVVEVLIVLMLATFELNAAKNLNHKQV